MHRKQPNQLWWRGGGGGGARGEMKNVTTLKLVRYFSSTGTIPFGIEGNLQQKYESNYLKSGS